jgi:hypothetical protein
MEENKPATLPKFNSTEELIEFCETHDMGEYDLPEVHFDVDLKRKRYLVSVDEAVMSSLMEKARIQQVSVELLVDSWLKEKLLSVS